MEISNAQYEKFLGTHGNKAGMVISALAKKSKFKEAIESELGQELLSDVLACMEEILPKIINEKATTQEKAEFRALRMISNRWQDKLASYNREAQKVINNTTKRMP